MGRLAKKSQSLGAVCIAAAIVAGGALPIVLGAGGAASSLGLKHAPVASCSPPAGQSAVPVAQASPPCTPKLTAKPHSGLRDGQTIKVTGSGFSPNDFVEMAECLTGTTDPQTGCDFETGGAADTDATGAFSTPVQVTRLIEPGTTVIDCATPGACVLAALGDNQEGIAATTPITFKNVPLQSLSVTPATGLADGQIVKVKGAHFERGSQVILTECPAGQSEVYDCDTDIAQTVFPGPHGTFSATFGVARILTTVEGEGSAGLVDCAQAPGCDLAAVTNFDEAAAATPLSFDPNIAPLPPLNVSLVLNSSGLVNVNGGAVLTGTISCTTTTPVKVDVEVNLAETSLGMSADSTTDAVPTCGQTPAPVSFTLPDQDVPFSAGIGEVTVNLTARDGSSVAQQMMSGAIALAVPAHQPPAVYYLALGESLAPVFSPVPLEDGYVADLQTHFQNVVPDLELVDLACPGETSTSMIAGDSCPYGAGSRLGAADAFLSAHKASVAFVTVEIGGGDYLDCIIQDPPGVNQQCITTTDATTTANLTKIGSQLKAAAGAAVPIVGMNYFDPFLAYWPDGALGRFVARESVTVIGQVNGAIADGYNSPSIPVADVAGAFQTTDLSQKVKTSFGRVPVAVANVCNWLDFTCAKNRAGFGEDTNAPGALVVAGAFEKVLPTAPVAGVKGAAVKGRHASGRAQGHGARARG